MCGIVGQIDQKKQIDPEVFNGMRDTLQHRGPDGYGTEILDKGRVAFGHRRLSIIDLSEDGKQPMTNEDRTIWLTFNGEIYNYQLIKDELLKKGHIFHSSTDSEVLIHGYEEWGMEGLLPRLKGMWSFAIWDDRKKQLLASRDRFGIKPFNYYHANGLFVFASEIKAIVKNPEVKKEIDKSAMADFFIYSYVPNPKCIWKNIHKLAPAHYLVYDYAKDEIKTSCYWKLGISTQKISEADAIERTNELMLNATKDHLVSDVPVGLFLSGGYDSTTLLMHMKDLGYQASTYSIGFKGSEKSEHVQAGLIAATFGAKHQENLLSPEIDIVDLLQKLSFYYDEPFAISSMLTYYYVSSFGAQHTKVALAGDGGDEAFAGYKWYYNIHNYFSDITVKERIKLLYFGRENMLLNKYNRWMTGVFSEIKNSNVLNAEITGMVEKQGLWYFERHYVKNTEPVKLFQHLDTHTFMADHCLVRADISSMAHSLEVRVPFLDHEIFEFTFSLPENMLIKKGHKKPLLRANLEGRVDRGILDMPKRGFSFHHLDDMFNHKFLDMVSNGELKKNGILNPGCNLEKLSGQVKFHLLVLELWMRKDN